VQGPQTHRPARGRDLRFHPAVGRGQSLLLLRAGSRVGSRVRQDRDLSAVSDQTLSEPARVGETTAAPRRDPVHQSRPRLPLVRPTPPPTYGYRTRIITDGVEPSLHIDYKHSHLKQYFKEGRGLRTELTINNPNDFDFRKALDQLPGLRALGDQVNRTVLTIE